MSTSEQKPSLYPNPSSSTSGLHPSRPPPPPPPNFELGASPLDAAALSSTSVTTPPTSSSIPAPSAPPVDDTDDVLPPDYEVVLEIDAHVQQIPSAQSPSSSQPVQPISRTALLRVIQGPLPPATSEESSSPPAYHAFISIDGVNIPLLPTAGASKFSTGAFYLSLPNYTFTIQPNLATEPELVDALERLLRWFCQWQTVTDGQAPATVPPVGSTEQTHLGQNNLSSKKSTADRIASAGDRGVLMVEKLGNSLNRKVTNALDKKREGLREEDAKKVKLGGKITNSLLSGTRRLVGSGAEVASKVTDRISSKVGGAVSGNRLSRSMAEAPEGSFKRSMYDALMAGALSFGRIYVEMDAQGKAILHTTGDGMSDIARLKYGHEAERAARNLTGIAVDGYRISRFPQKLGATSIVKGALKSRFAQNSHVAVNETPPRTEVGRFLTQQQ